jgi:gamma-glutamylcyclotransferase
MQTQLEKSNTFEKGNGNGDQPKAKAVAKVYYFAFGSNMNVARMSQRGVEYTRRMGATLKGYRLVFNKRAAAPGQGYANIIVGKKGNDEVQGVLYETSEAGLAKLDAYEGVPSHYYRQQVRVETLSGQKRTATVYIAHPSMCASGLKPSREYLDHLLEGKTFLSAEYFAKLSKTPTIAVAASWSRFGSGWGRGRMGNGSGSKLTRSSSSSSSSFASSPSPTQSHWGTSDFGNNSNSSLLRQAKLPLDGDGDAYLSANYYSEDYGSEDYGFEDYETESDNWDGWESSSSNRNFDQERKKNIQFEALLVELLENLDYDYDYRLYIQELLYTEARKRGVSSRQLFSLALLRSLTDVAEGKIE